MQDDRGNVVRFRRRPSPPPPPRRPKPSHERAINWSKAPRAAAIIILVMLALWFVGRIAGWVSGVGMS